MKENSTPRVKRGFAAIAKKDKGSARWDGTNFPRLLRHWIADSAKLETPPRDGVMIWNWLFGRGKPDDTHSDNPLADVLRNRKRFEFDIPFVEESGFRHLDRVAIPKYMHEQVPDEDHQDFLWRVVAAWMENLLADLGDEYALTFHDQILYVTDRDRREVIESLRRLRGFDHACAKPSRDTE